MDKETADKPERDFVHERAFLFRSWPDERGGWRFNLQTIGPRPRRIGFTTLDEMFDFLRAAFPTGGDRPAGHAHEDRGD